MKGLVQAKSASKLLSGDKLSPFVSAASSAAMSYIKSTGTITSTNNALGPGSGTFIGRISGVSDKSMSNIMNLKAASSQMSGRDIKKLFDAISFGVAQAMKTSISQGTVVGAGPGTGNGKILGIMAKPLATAIMAQMGVKFLNGDKMRAMTNAVATGIQTHILSSARVSTTCVGAAAGPPAGPVTIPTAPGTGRFVT